MSLVLLAPDHYEFSGASKLRNNPIQGNFQTLKND